MTNVSTRVASLLPSVEEVWERTFLRVVAEWAAPVGTAERHDETLRFTMRGNVIAVEFDPHEWFELITSLYVRSVHAGELELGDVELRDDLWADELYHLFFSGAPCIAIRHGDLVALDRPHGAPWKPRSRRSPNDKPRGRWTPEP